MKKIAYVRASTLEQNIHIQKKDIADFVDIDKWYIEKASAKDTKRSELNKLLDYVREEDTIYVNSLDRLARNTKDLLNIIEYLYNKKVTIHFIKESLTFDNSSYSKMIVTVLSAVAEFERSLLLERQAEGIAVAKEKGKYKGRKKIKVNQEQLAELHSDWLKGYITKDEMAEKLNISRSTLYRRLDEMF